MQDLASYIWNMLREIQSEVSISFGSIQSLSAKEFMEVLTAGADPGLDDWMGVNFHFAYLAADKVQAATEHFDIEQSLWESAAGGTFNSCKFASLANPMQLFIITVRELDIWLRTWISL